MQSDLAREQYRNDILVTSGATVHQRQSILAHFPKSGMLTIVILNDS
jgi:hypothetical protein